MQKPGRTICSHEKFGGGKFVGCQIIIRSALLYMAVGQTYTQNGFLVNGNMD